MKIWILAIPALLLTFTTPSYSADELSVEELCASFTGSWEFTHLMTRSSQGGEILSELKLKDRKPFHLVGVIDAASNTCTFEAFSLSSDEDEKFPLKMDDKIYEVVAFDKSSTVQSEWVGNQVHVVQKMTYEDVRKNWISDTVLTVTGRDTIQAEISQRVSNVEGKYSGTATLRGHRLASNVDREGL